jgi:hypothetical protein
MKQRQMEAIDFFISGPFHSRGLSGGGYVFIKRGSYIVDRSSAKFHKPQTLRCRQSGAATNQPTTFDPGTHQQLLQAVRRSDGPTGRFHLVWGFVLQFLELFSN